MCDLESMDFLRFVIGLHTRPVVDVPEADYANRDGIVIFAHNSRKGSIKSAAEDVAKKLKDHIAAGTANK